MKLILYILIPLALIYFLYRLTKSYIGKISVNVNPTLPTVTEIAGKDKFTFSLVIRIDNKNTLSIDVKNIFVRIFYAGSQIAQSTNSDQVFIPSGGSATLMHVIGLNINSSLISALADKSNVSYLASFRILGIPLQYKGNLS